MYGFKTNGDDNVAPPPEYFEVTCMDLRRMVTTIVCFLCLLCFFGCNKEPVDTDPVDRHTAATESEKQATGIKESETKTTGIKESETKMIGINDTRDGIIVDDILDCIDMLGKTAAEIGIPIGVINTESKYFTKTYIDGNIFGTKDYGVLYFDVVSNGKDDYLAESMWIHIKNISYNECKRQLSERFGNPISEGDNPYVEIDGGAVTWAYYQHPDVKIRLSSASKRDYVEIHIEKLTD